MDIRRADELAQDRQLFDRMAYRINTAIPGVIVSFDPETRLAEVNPAIMQKTFIDGATGYEQLPTIISVPCYFPFSSISGFSLTFPVKTGDSCLLIFSQRCIDNWLENGGIQLPEDGLGSRHHDITDAFALVGFTSLVDEIPTFNMNGIELRNRDASIHMLVTDSKVEVKAGTSILTMNSDGIATYTGTTLSVSAKTTFTDDVTFQGKMTDKNGIDHTNHKHGGVSTGSGTSGAPTS